MKTGFYAKLAYTGIRKNRKLYNPYLLTSMGIVMMHYIIRFLSYSSIVGEMTGGDTMQGMLSMGVAIIRLFAVIFLFYTNSFLSKRRRKEFGLYNILGMGKGNISRILCWESVILLAASLGGGLFGGIFFSKAAELCMINLLQEKAEFSFRIDPESIGKSITLFSGIFFLILIKNLLQMWRQKPVELLRSEQEAEKPPRANWAGALLGAILLGAAYWIAVSVTEPVVALLFFFLAVALVILATYLLFLAGSVAVCRILQKNKRYYYQTRHFVSVSSMAYRMRKNGAGLASICILSTMVLVMISMTTCLYIGGETLLNKRYPRELVIETQSWDDSLCARVETAAEEVVEERQLRWNHLLNYRIMTIRGYQSGKEICVGSPPSGSGTELDVYVISLEDYNRVMGEELSLGEGEALLYTDRSADTGEEISLKGYGILKIRDRVKQFESYGKDIRTVYPSIYLFVRDPEKIWEAYSQNADGNGNSRIGLSEYFGFDLDGGKEEQKEAAAALRAVFSTWQEDEAKGINLECRQEEKGYFYGMYGGLFFLGILLGLVFTAALVLIMYYKQITEGYEDQDRFAILQKVGMTKKEIQSSINSQILTVFFLPLAVAGIHTLFAFAILSRILEVFWIKDRVLIGGVMGGCFVVFAVFYVIMYRITSREYYRIVSDNRVR